VFEKNTYSVQNGQSLFKVHKRCGKRLQLICRNIQYIGGCKFSISCSKNTLNLQQLHTCSYSNLKRSDTQSNPVIPHEELKPPKDSCSQNTTVSTPLTTATSTSGGTCSTPFVAAARNSSGSSLDNKGSTDGVTATQMSLSVNRKTGSTTPPSTDDYIWSDGDYYGSGSSIDIKGSEAVAATQKSLSVVSSNSKASPPSTALWNTSNDSSPSGDSTTTAVPSANRLNFLISDSSNNGSSKRTPCNIRGSACNSFVAADIAPTDSSSMQHFQLFKEAFSGYHSTERDNIIFQLQMINSIRKDYEESVRNWQNRYVDPFPSPKKKQKLADFKNYPYSYLDFDDNDEEEIIFRDK
jgi:hypothetical protein